MSFDIKHDTVETMSDKMEKTDEESSLAQKLVFGVCVVIIVAIVVMVLLMDSNNTKLISAINMSQQKLQFEEMIDELNENT
jgi:hypothetical protein|uniref:Uncharacterized protein n=1 Tax=viral metagenome TaxID=1070528 RepID=A0A6C0IW05_9ZZZZ